MVVFVDRGRIRITSTRRATPFERHEYEEADGDSDTAPEYDFKDAVPNPYADRYRGDHVPVVTGLGTDDVRARSARTGPKKERGRYAKMLADGFDVEIEPPKNGSPDAS